MTIYKWPYKNDHILLKKVAHHFSRLGMQQLQESTTSGRLWSCGRVHRVLLSVRLSVISLRWRGGSDERMPSWRLASGNHASCVVAFCLWIPTSTGRSWPSPDEESHVLEFVSVPQGGVQNLSLRPWSRSTWRLFHLSHYLLFHLFFSYIFWSAWERGEQEFW